MGQAAVGKKLGVESQTRRHAVADVFPIHFGIFVIRYSKDIRRIFEGSSKPFRIRFPLVARQARQHSLEIATSAAQTLVDLGDTLVRSKVSSDETEVSSTVHGQETPNTYKGTPVPGQCISEPFSHPIIYNN